MKKAIVTGITGQDGSYLAEHLLNLGYEVFGTYRRSSSTNFWRIEELGIYGHNNLNLVEFDLIDASSAIRMIDEIEPDEIYNLAAQSFVALSFKQPILTGQITGIGPVNILEAIRIVNPDIKFYQASTSELYGYSEEVPQNENTPFYPRSPYGAAKLYAHWMTINYRESYDIFGCCGILFNHESPMRGIEFVTRKITDAVARIVTGEDHILELGNMDSKRDWGFAGDYVKGMHLMLQQDEPDEYVLATGVTHTIRDFVEMAFMKANIQIEWHGHGEDETGVDESTGKTLVRVNPEFYRPADVNLLLGDPTKAYRDIGWQATTDLDGLCDMMVQADIGRYKLKYSLQSV